MVATHRLSALNTWHRYGRGKLICVIDVSASSDVALSFRLRLDVIEGLALLMVSLVALELACCSAEGEEMIAR
jgi:hypothetical protein